MLMPSFICRTIPAGATAILAMLWSHAAFSAPIATLEVDARDAPRGIERAHMVLPVKPGKLTLLYPKWLPGEHQANGPIGGLAGLKFSINDWRAFWSERLNRLRPAAPLEGLGAAGWHLRFDSEESEEQKGNDAARKSDNVLFSLGFSLMADGAVVTDLVPGSPADLAGISPDSRLIAVNGRKYSKDVLQDALKAGGNDARSIKLLVQKDDSFMTLDARYAGHASYPHIERDAAVADTLSAILSSRTP
jgi:hypothetical protein